MILYSSFDIYIYKPADTESWTKVAMIEYWIWIAMFVQHLINLYSTLCVCWENTYVQRYKLKQYKHGVQRRMVLSGQFFRIFPNYYYFLLCCWYMRPSARCRGYTLPVLTAISIWKFFSEIWVMPVKLQFPVSRASLIFQKDFQMLVAAKENEI